MLLGWHKEVERDGAAFPFPHLSWTTAVILCITTRFYERYLLSLTLIGFSKTWSCLAVVFLNPFGDNQADVLITFVLYLKIVGQSLKSAEQHYSPAACLQAKWNEKRWPTA